MADLAHTAALLVPILIEREHALGSNQVHALLRIREGVLDPDAIVLLHSIKQLVRLSIQATSVQTAVTYVQSCPAYSRCSVVECHAFNDATCAHDNVAMMLTDNASRCTMCGSCVSCYAAWVSSTIVASTVCGS